MPVHPVREDDLAGGVGRQGGGHALCAQVAEGGGGWRQEEGKAGVGAGEGEGEGQGGDDDGGFHGVDGLGVG